MLRHMKYILIRCSGTLKGEMEERAQSLEMNLSEYIKFIAIKDITENVRTNE